jgi:deoxyribodipyrimidine photolyase-like uncharacterized protein
MIKEIIEGYKKGTYINLKTQRLAKTKKGFTGELVKETLYKNARLGIIYDNISQTVKKRSEGELPQENQGLPWGEWELFPYIITHKGQRYLRAYVDKELIETIWWFNGIIVKKHEIEEFLLSSEINNKPITDKYLTLVLKEDSIIISENLQ